MPKLSQEIINEAAAAIWDAGEPVNYDSVRARLRCRKIDLAPYMQSVLSDPRNKRKPAPGISQALNHLRSAVAAEANAFFAEQLAEVAQEIEELSAKLASRDVALETAEARIAELNVLLAAANAEILTTRAAAERQTAPLLKIVTAAFRSQTERPKTPKIAPCSKWTAI
ncbi:MAG: hypothetical protein WCP06_14320 [Verrucomicrobiota bacterium]